MFERWKVKRDMRKLVASARTAARKAKENAETPEALNGERALASAALGDRHSIDMRVTGAVVLGEIGTTSDVRSLIRAMLEDETWIVSQEAATALGKLGGEEAAAALNAVRDAPETDIQVKLAATKAYTAILRAEAERLKRQTRA